MEEYREYKTLMLILTENCNLNCVYCYEHHKTLDDMPFETAKKAIEIQPQSKWSDLHSDCSSLAHQIAVLIFTCPL